MQQGKIQRLPELNSYFDHIPKSYLFSIREQEAKLEAACARMRIFFWKHFIPIIPFLAVYLAPFIKKQSLYDFTVSYRRTLDLFTRRILSYFKVHWTFSYTRVHGVVHCIFKEKVFF